jgi:Fe-S-cluster containining protein
MKYREYAEKIMQVYEDLDELIAQFQEETGWSCLPGCGDCCQTDRVEASIAEFMPLALHLMENNEMHFWLDKLEKQGEEKQCIFYKPDERIPGHGRCVQYSHRGLVCRLFNFSAVADKYGKKIFQACGIMKKQQAARAAALQELIGQRQIPLMTDFSMRIHGINPSLGTKMYPVNQAVRLAIEMTGLTPQNIFRKTV